MSTKMDGIYQQSLFSKSLGLSVIVSENSRYRILANTLPWIELANTFNHYRAEKVNINIGRKLNLRLHIGAYIAQSMNGWSDRETEEMVRYHVGVRILCGLEESLETLDRTSIETFRNQIGPEGSEAINSILILHAMGAGYTDSEICASDTTVQEAPIAYPTEVGHMQKIAEKLLSLGKKAGLKSVQSLKDLGQKAKDTFTEIRLFTRGKKEAVIEAKKKLGKKMHEIVSSMLAEVDSGLKKAGKKKKEASQDTINLCQHMLEQIEVWMKTGFHPANKIISLWDTNARAIAKEKTGKAVEFGRRWLITRLLGGYVIGSPCIKLGSDSDANIAEEVLIQFLNIFGESPKSFIYDRGGDGPKNHELLANLGVEDNCIFRKGSEKMSVEDSVFEMARKERALTEASIATLKTPKYNFNKPRARSMESCVLKGHTAILGFNINNLLKDIIQTWDLVPEIT